jgi:hypothetical protein
VVCASPLSLAEQEVFTLVDLYARVVSITLELFQARAVHTGMSVIEVRARSVLCALKKPAREVLRQCSSPWIIFVNSPGVEDGHVME